MSFSSNSVFSNLARLGCLFALTLFLNACANLQLQSPQVSVISISPSQNSGLDLGFDVKLKVTNPNAIALPIEGMNYALALNGAKLLRGTTGKVPTIAAYGSETIDISVSTNLLSAPQFLVGLLGKSNEDISYELSGTLDLAGYLPSLSISESGKVPLR